MRHKGGTWRLAGVALAALIFLVIVLVLRGRHHTERFPHRVEDRAARTYGLPSSAPSLPSSSEGSAATGHDIIVDPDARETVDALQQLQQEFMPAFDGCVGPTRAQRKPVPLVVRFEHVDTDQGSARFAAREVVIPERVLPRVEHCLQLLRGRELVVRSHATDAFVQRLNIFVPGES